MKKTKLIDLYAALLVIIGVAAVILRTAAYFTGFNKVTMHFDDKILITVANVLVVVCALLFATYLFVESKSFNPVASNNNGATYIPAGIVCISLLFMAADRSVALRQAAELRSNAALRHLTILVIALAIISVAAFFLMIFISKNESTTKTVMCLGIVLYLCAYVAYLYFNKTEHPTNSPGKIVDQMAYIFSAMFFLYETRIALGRTIWRPYVSLGFMASLTTAYSAIPTLVVYLANGYMISDSIYETAVTLTLCIFITSRVFLTKKLYSSVQCAEAQTVEMLAQIREKEISDKRIHPLTREESNKEEDETVDTENYSFDIPPIEHTAKSDGE